MSVRRFWFRVEASADVGLGHLMRCVAIADSARERGSEVRFVTDHGAVVSGILRQRAHVLGGGAFGDRDWIQDVRPGDAVVFDGYGLARRDREAAKEKQATVVVVDDGGTSDEAMDVLVCPDVDYSGPWTGDVLVLSGLNHALIRAEFRQYRRARPEGSMSLAVTLGGGETGAPLRALVSWLRGRKVFPDVKIIVGALAREQPVTSLAGGIRVVVNPVNMATELDRCDAALTGAGTTMLELCCIGMPMAALIVAEDQEGAGEILRRAAAGILLGRVADLPPDPSVLERLTDPGVRREMSSRALELVDGLGAARVVDAIMSGFP